MQVGQPNINILAHFDELDYPSVVALNHAQTLAIQNLKQTFNQVIDRGIKDKRLSIWKKDIQENLSSLKTMQFLEKYTLPSFFATIFSAPFYVSTGKHMIMPPVFAFFWIVSKKFYELLGGPEETKDDIRMYRNTLTIIKNLE